MPYLINKCEKAEYVFRLDQGLLVGVFPELPAHRAMSWRSALFFRPCPLWHQTVPEPSAIFLHLLLLSLARDWIRSLCCCLMDSVLLSFSCKSFSSYSRLARISFIWPLRIVPCCWARLVSVSAFST